MKRVAFIFNSVPHGSCTGREGLDAVLATSALTEDVAVFFIGDGVLQLLPAQLPDKILARDYIATFRVLPLYDVKQIFLCAASAGERGLSVNKEWVLDPVLLEPEALCKKLHQFDTIFTF